MFKKQISSLFAGALLALSSSVFANTIHFTQYTLEYTDAPSVVATSFFGGGGGSVGFGFKLLPSLNVLNTGTGIVSTAFALPTFTVTPAAGYALSGEILGSIGNLSYAEAPGALTSVTFSGTAAIDGVPTVFLNQPLTKDAFSTASGEFRSASSTIGQGVFNTLTFGGGTLTLTADNTLGVFSTISSQSQSEFRISFTALPVPELESYAMLLAGLCLIGAIARRRTQDM